MRATFHVKKFYDWAPVPPEVKAVTQQDIAAERVKPAANGTWRMKITRPGPTHTDVFIPEEQVIAKIIHEKTRPEGGRVLTRKEAIAFYIGEHVLPHHAHRSWLSKIEVHDDGPDEDMMKAMLAPHGVAEASRVKACVDAGTHKVERRVEDGDSTNNMQRQERCAACGHIPSIGDAAEEPNIPVSEHLEHIQKYMESCDAKALAAHLHTHFKVKEV